MMVKAKALIDGRRRDSARGLTLLGVELRDAKEEVFVRMVCDGLAIGIAFHRAGFSSKTKDAPYNLWQLPRVQERASKILEARRSTGVVTLPEVTDMLQRVFAGAHSEGEYSAAHNAAFSLARLYGHVTDRSVIEHIRRPSRDPDAPSETALEAWAASLPVVGQLETPSQIASNSPLDRAPAPLLGLEPSPPSPELTAVNSPDGPFPYASQAEPSTEQPQQYQGLSGEDHLCDRPEVEENKVDWLGSEPGRMAIGNEAPVGPVTGTPYACGRSPLLENGSPSADEGTGPDREKVAIEGGPMSPNVKWPPIEDLF